jgi:hypothetical protein
MEKIKPAVTDYKERIPHDQMWDTHNSVHAEYEKAVQRVGVSAEDAMKWILKFIDPQNAQYNLEQLTPSELENVKFEIVAFVGQPHQIGSFSEDFIIDTESSVKNSPGTTLVEPNLPTKNEVHQLQEDVRQSFDVRQPLDSFFKYGNPSISFILPQVQVIVARLSNPPRGQFFISGKCMEMFIFKYCQCLAHFLPRLRNCMAPDCLRLFLAEHGRKQYCTKKCQNRIGVRNFRKKAKLKKNKSSVQPKKGISHGTKKRKG